MSDKIKWKSTTFYQIKTPKDLKKLDYRELNQLAQEIRQYLIENITKHGGHLGSNLGSIEFTIALHRVFNTPKDSLIFDTGHQSLTHKILTNRKDFRNFRKKNGLSSYPKRQESEHDILENTHASVSLGWADGIAKANLLQHNKNWTVAIVGDGALTGGLVWESINKIQQNKKERLIILINDNGMSYSPTKGGYARYLQQLKVSKQWDSLSKSTKKFLSTLGLPGHLIRKGLGSLKDTFVRAVDIGGIFKDYDLTFLGPINGHNIKEVERALQSAKRLNEPVIIHMRTKKGKGLEIAENDQNGKFHAIKPGTSVTGTSVENKKQSSGKEEADKNKTTQSWSQAFGEELVKLAKTNHNIVAITAAMTEPVGLEDFQKHYPKRFFDVGIAEGNSFLIASGLSYKGFHPFVCLYSTFALRGLDQWIYDIGLHNQKITLVLDRSGITGSDGPSHNGIFDLALFSKIPQVHIATPYDKKSLIQAMKDSLKISAPSVIRYPKGNINNDNSNDNSNGISTFDQKYHKKNSNTLSIILGPLTPPLAKNTYIYRPLWAFPIDKKLLDLTAKFQKIQIFEDGIINGGFGQQLKAKLGPKDVSFYGVEQEFLPEDSRDNYLKKFNLA